MIMSRFNDTKWVGRLPREKMQLIPVKHLSMKMNFEVV